MLGHNLLRTSDPLSTGQKELPFRRFRTGVGKLFLGNYDYKL